MSVINWHFATEEGIAMCFLIEPVYGMTWLFIGPITIFYTAFYDNISIMFMNKSEQSRHGFPIFIYVKFP